jgi:hypothetical protein
MPKIEQTIADINVRSHTFAFIAPEMTDQYKIPNPCTGCHTDNTTAWAREAMKGWAGVSPGGLIRPLALSDSRVKEFAFQATFRKAV